MVEKTSLSYDDYLNQKSITELLDKEKKYYLEYLKNAYKEDLKHSKDTLFSSQKWSIIAGYYAMHNISKYYLALNYKKKISTPNIHEATISALKKLVDNNEVKELMKKAEEFAEIEPLYHGLIKGKQERNKTQYYTNETESSKKITLEKANYFLNNIVEKYIELVERLIENVK